jgi:hypothetical protein
MTDFYRLLEAFNQIESNLNPAQRSVKQMPALFKMPKQGPVLGGDPNKKAPSQGYFVGGESQDVMTAPSDVSGYGVGTGDDGADETPDGIAPDTKTFLESDDDNAMKSAVTRRIMNAHMEWITRYGIENLVDVIDDATDDWDGEEIGSSDVSAYVHRVKDELQRRNLGEAKATEDVISTVKKKLGDYLSDLSKEIKSDSDLKDKLPQNIDTISSAVKTITTDDGREIKIHGNEDDGFRITIRNKPHSAKFESLDHAVMACEMYCQRRRNKTQLNNNDYMEEK